MPRSNSNGPSGRRKPSSKGNSFRKSTGGPREGSGNNSRRRSDSSEDRPFKKSPRKSFSGDSSGGKPFKKSPRKFSGDASNERPFRKSPRKSFSGDSSGDRPFKKSPRKFSDDSKNERPFRKSPGKSFSGDSSNERPFRKSPRKFSGDSDGGRPFKRSGKSFGKPASENFERKDKPASSGDNRRTSQKSNPNYSRPFKRKSFDGKGPGKRRDDESTEKGGFFTKGNAKGRRPRKDFSKPSEEAPLQDKLIRLNKYIANSGVCSRREADELITMGLISVNGKVITELGYKVNPGDEVRHENKVLRAEKPVYILMNKPKGYLTTTTDPQERNTVMHILGDAVRERIYPVGRLDRNTTGLLLFTNDGDLAEKLMHPSYNVKKIYKVELDRPLTKADFERIKEGVHLEEGKAVVDDLAIISDDGRTVGVEIHIGWNRVIRRIFETLDYAVVKLDRSVYAGLDKKDLSRGHWRFLTKEEIVRLKHYNK